MNSEAIICEWEELLRRSEVGALREYWQQRVVPRTLEMNAQRALLFELAALELEYHWKQHRTAGRATAAAVAQEFTELCDHDLRCALVAEEYRARWRFGDRPRLDEFGAEYRELLAAVDQELRAEFGPRLSSAATEPRGSTQIQFDPRAPLSAADYLVQRFLGAGSLGRVYVARQHSLQRSVALKFLRKSYLRNAAAVERFLQEARLAGRLRHPGIISVHGLGRTRGGSYFLAMDLITGGPLQSIDSHDPWQLRQLLDSIAQAAEAMTAAHAAGVIHCDLKPANILRDDSGRVTLTDFGLARQLADDALQALRGEGTPACIAPEQVDACWGPVGAATDVFNLGATLFALIAGRSPHDGGTVPEILASAVSGQPVIPLRALLPKIPPALSDLCDNCLKKSPHGERPTMAELAGELRTI